MAQRDLTGQAGIGGRGSGNGREGRLAVSPSEMVSRFNPSTICQAYGAGRVNRNQNMVVSYLKLVV